MNKLDTLFFTKNPVICARELVGALFHWRGCCARIVETEAYAAVGDAACHTWSRPSARAFVAGHAPGTAYVYLNYGVHWMFNFLVKGPDGEGFVLLRALEPVIGLKEMQDRRPKVSDHLLCAGPGRLTRALGLDGTAHGVDFLNDPDGGVTPGGTVEIVAGGRIGISQATELPWRFGEAGSASLSRKF